MSRRPAPTLPLWVWAAGGTLAVGLVVTGGFGGGLALTGQLHGSRAALCFGLGGAAILVATVGAALAANRTAAALRALRDDALQRLREPDSGQAPGPRGGVRGTAELSELSSALEALALRMRVADELALRLRDSADTASAGMFELLSGLIAAEEGARGQLAAELHDTVAQSLSVARVLLAAGEIQRAGEQVAEAEDQIRAVMARTRPPALRDGDLGEAVGALRDDLQRRYGLAVSISWPHDPQPLPLATAVTIYRFFQEALLNVVKHADVDAADAELEVVEEMVVATVRDLGAGFVPSQVRSTGGRHVGLGLLRERVRLAGGVVEVQSHPGAGSTLVMRLPVGARGDGRVGASAPPLLPGTVLPGPRVSAVRS